MAAVNRVVRTDLAEAHQRSLAHIAAPGARLDADTRVRLAEIAIAAYLDPAPPPPWATPHGEPLADAVPRLAPHAGPPTADWYTQLIGSGVHPLDWVEAVGVVIAALPPVAFARAIGAPLPAIPAPAHGNPHGREAAELAPARLNWVPVAAPADKVASVVQALSALPDEWDNLWRLAEAQYMGDRQMDDPRWNRGTLSRPQMELVAGRLSLIRECFF